MFHVFGIPKTWKSSFVGEDEQLAGAMIRGIRTLPVD
jgi:hypothetical protein